MRDLKTCPALAPPPPVPPVSRAPAAAADPSPDPARSLAWPKTTAHFLSDVMLDLRRMVWPPRSQVCAETLVTIGLLGCFACYISALDNMIHALLHFIGLY